MDTISAGTANGQGTAAADGATLGKVDAEVIFCRLSKVILTLQDDSQSLGGIDQGLRVIANLIAGAAKIVVMQGQHAVLIVGIANRRLIRSGSGRFVGKVSTAGHAYAAHIYIICGCCQCCRILHHSGFHFHRGCLFLGCFRSGRGCLLFYGCFRGGRGRLLFLGCFRGGRGGRLVLGCFRGGRGCLLFYGCFRGGRGCLLNPDAFLCFRSMDMNGVCRNHSHHHNQCQKQAQESF